MYNYTNCIIVVRNYYYETERDLYELVRIKEYIFRNTKTTRRYSLFFDQKKRVVYDMTEHHWTFFDKVVKASSGWGLFNLYLQEKIDPVPVSELLADPTNSVKYNNLEEFYVIYNCMYNEASFAKMKKNKKRSMSDLYNAS